MRVWPKLPVIAVVPDGSVSIAVQLARSGAFHVIQRSSVEQELAAVVAEALNAGDQRGRMRTADGGWCHLTDHEQRLLELTMTGLANKQIAKRLDISLRSVHIHRAAMMKKLGVHTKAELVRLAFHQHPR